MRALVQRVSQAAVDVVAQIGPGMPATPERATGRATSRRRRASGRPLYDRFCERFCERLGAAKGIFGACMGVALVNDGPVTLLVEA